MNDNSDPHTTRSFKAGAKKAPSSGIGDSTDLSRLLVAADSPGGDSQELRRLVGTDEDLAELLTRLQDHHWRINKSELEVCVRPDGSDHIAASGTFGTVFKGVLNKSLTVAIKRCTNRQREHRVSFLEEIVCLMNLRHANIVQFFGTVIDDDVIIMVTEYMVRGSLYDVIARDKEGRARWHARGRSIALDITRGLMYMHGRNSIHQDLKSKNVLVARDWSAKLCDLGMCTMPKLRSDSEGKLGTLEYCAPEVLEGSCKAASKASDIFSLGVVLWEIVTGKAPEKRNLPIEDADKCPPDVAKLIRSCTSAKPEDRPSIDQVFQAISGKRPPATRPLSGSRDSMSDPDDVLPDDRPGDE